MNIDSKFSVMIFKNQNQFGTFYSLGLSKKDKEGKYLNGYISCQFANGVELEDKTKIYLKKAWLSFYLKDKETKPYIFISEFEVISNANQQTKPEQDPFLDYEISDDDLPF